MSSYTLDELPMSPEVAAVAKEAIERGLKEVGGMLTGDAAAVMAIGLASIIADLRKERQLPQP